jgi:hypothetical protein
MYGLGKIGSSEEPNSRNGPLYPRSAWYLTAPVLGNRVSMTMNDFQPGVPFQGCSLGCQGTSAVEGVHSEAEKVKATSIFRSFQRLTDTVVWFPTRVLT